MVRPRGKRAWRMWKRPPPSRMLSLAERLVSLMGSKNQANWDSPVHLETKPNCPESAQQIQIWACDESGRHRGEVSFFNVSEDPRTTLKCPVNLTFFPSDGWNQTGNPPKKCRENGDDSVRMRLKIWNAIEENALPHPASLPFHLSYDDYMERCNGKSPDALRIWSQSAPGNPKVVEVYLCPLRSTYKRKLAEVKALPDTAKLVFGEEDNYGHNYGDF